MPIRICIIGCFLLYMGIASGRSRASEVTLQYKQIILNANLELAVGSKFIDGEILITHGGLMHRGMEIHVYLQKLLKEQGYNTLAINLSLGLNNRHGRYDCKTTHRHRYTDTAKETMCISGIAENTGRKTYSIAGAFKGRRANGIVCRRACRVSGESPKVDGRG